MAVTATKVLSRLHGDMMADISYKWQLVGVDGHDIPEQELKDVVKVVHWRCVGIYNANTKLSASVNGFTVVHDPDPTNFKQYDSLTSDEILSWLTPYINESVIKAAIVEALSAAKEVSGMTTRSALPQTWR